MMWELVHYEGERRVQPLPMLKPFESREEAEKIALQMNGAYARSQRPKKMVNDKRRWHIEVEEVQ